MTSSRAQRGPVLALVVLLLAVLGACNSSASDPEPSLDPSVDAGTDARIGPEGAAFYEPPDNLSEFQAGDLIWTRPFAGSHALQDATNHLVLHAQRGIGGDIVATSGVVSLPEGPAPEGGWPVITWAHGTTGIADECAPSRVTGFGLGGLDDLLLQQWLDGGNAIVRTDYEGLGTPGEHPYLIGTSAGRSVLDIVRAARELEPEISPRVVIAGHSQGGHAALWAAGMAPQHDPELDILGTIAVAPPSNLAVVLDGVLDGTVKSPPVLVAMILRGLDIGYPQKIDVENVLKPAALELYPRTLDTCLPALGTPDKFGSMSAGELVQANADLDVIERKLKDNDPSATTIPSPVLLLQGERDTVVSATMTDKLADAYEQQDVDLTYRTYPEANHASVLTEAAKGADRFIAEWFAGKPD